MCWDGVTFLVQREGLAQGSACDRTHWVDIRALWAFPSAHCFLPGGTKNNKAKALTFSFAPGSLGPVAATFQIQLVALQGRVQQAEKNWEKGSPKPLEEVSAWVILVSEILKGCFVVFKLYLFFKNLLIPRLWFLWDSFICICDAKVKLFSWSGQSGFCDLQWWSSRWTLSSTVWRTRRLKRLWKVI